ncbi:MAG: GntR family transcriptional regulator [Dermatophilaceae bacterium]
MITEDVKQRLLRLELYPGSPIRESEVARRYDTSRHTARAAIASLAAEGVLVHDRHRGARVREFGPADVGDAFDLREALELQAVRLICQRRPRLDVLVGAVDRLDVLEATERTSDLRVVEWETLQADRAAHRALVDAAGSERISRAYRSIDLEIAYCYALYRVQATPPDDFEHRTVLAALQAGDEDVATAVLRSHIDVARAACLSAASAAPAAAEAMFPPK